MKTVDTKQYKYNLRVIISFVSGVGSLEIYRYKKVETASEFNELTNYLRKENPFLKELFITNILYFTNK